MKKNFKKLICNFDGKPVTDSEGSDLSLQTVVIESLLGEFKGEQVSGEERLRRYKLAKTIHDSEDGIVDVSLEDLALIKARVPIFYLTIVSGQVWEFLEE